MIRTARVVWRPLRAVAVVVALLSLGRPLLDTRAHADQRAGQSLEPVQPGGSRGVVRASESSASDIDVFHVQRNVYMLVGAGANVAVQVGQEGVLVVDPGLANRSEQVLAAIRTISDKPIRWVINTHFHPDHSGANAVVSAAGSTAGGAAAPIAAHENVLASMTESGVPFEGRPLNTFFGASKDFSFNDEAIVLYHAPEAHTDGDAIVFFRSSDVLVAGDLFVTTSYPILDLENGGGIQGVIEGLNHLLDLAVPRHQQEGGTYIIPGHGRVSDESDLLEYRDMVVIVRDRIRTMIDDGMTLDQVQSARPTLDYDGWHGGNSDFWTPEMFVEAVYTDLSKGDRAIGR
jgi:glyoxylase-like metal-dependent hydrolase (beta-lactamase superfamily II)